MDIRMSVFLVLVTTALTTMLISSKFLQSDHKNQCPINFRSYSSANEEQLCSPATRVVLLKTHKTGGSTIASILGRYAYTRNLNLPRFKSTTNSRPFYRQMLEGQPNLKMLVSHTLYNRPEMDFVFRDAKYVTIIREPAAQFESTFFFFKMSQELHLEQVENPIEEFMRSPKTYKNTKGFIQRKKSLNDQFRVLGLPESKFTDEWFIRYKLKQLEFEIDLVMINEYFDESLILLKKTLCWQFDDILYLSKNVRSKSNRTVLTSTLKEKIRSWNSADVILYDHFNRTFWRRISEYGDSFFEDLNKFRKLKVASNEMCVASFFNKSNDGRPDLKLIALKESLSEKDAKTCQNLNHDAHYFMRIMDSNKSSKLHKHM